MSSDTDTNFDDELDRLAASLPQAVAPERDLWPDVEQAILQPAHGGGANRQAAWNSPWAQAAAVVLLIAGSSGVTYLALEDGPRSTPQVVYTNGGNIFESASGNFGQQYTLGNEYLDARRSLESDLDEKLDSLSLEAREAVVKNLSTIRVAIKEINQSLAAEPDNKLLKELLLSAYHDEMSLMKRVNGIANTAMLREDI